MGRHWPVNAHPVLWSNPMQTRGYVECNSQFEDSHTAGGGLEWDVNVLGSMFEVLAHKGS